MNEVKQGKIEAYFPQRAFGFIHAIENGNLRRYFFHVSGIVAGYPMVGFTAEFVIDETRIIPGKDVLPVKDVRIDVGGAL
jgi:hypothetical protein